MRNFIASIVRACGCLRAFGVLTGLLALFVMGAPARSGDAVGVPAKNSPVVINVLVSSDSDRCHIPGLVAAINKFTAQEAAHINANGGIAGHPLRLRVLDDYEDAAKTLDNVIRSLADDRLVGLIGISSSTRGKAVFDGIGHQIGGSDVAFLTEISMNGMFAPYNNVFTLAGSVTNELDVLQAFMAERRFARPAFIGLSDHRYSAAQGDGLKTRLAAAQTPLVADHRLKIVDYQLQDAQALPVIEDLKLSKPDVVFLSIQSGAGGQFLSHLVAAGINVPVFVTLGRISRIVRKMGDVNYNNTIYQFAWDGVPNAYNERLRRRIWRSGSRNWIFDDLAVKLEPEEWSRRGCKKRKITRLTVLDDRNRRAIGRGAQYRDMLALIADAAKSAPVGASIMQLRRHIVEQIGRYRQGKRVLRGWWQDWSFTKARASAADTLIIKRDGVDSGIVLADAQYARVGGKLEPRPVVYISLDLISISRIDTNDKSFDAEFYLSLKSTSQGIGIDAIDFTNAYRSQTGRTRLISWREIHSGNGGTNFPAGVKLYKVTGKFNFQPDLGRYPFDTQRLSISFQPASTSRPFLIQPPTRASRLSRFQLDGWRALDQYVGSDQDIIPTIDQHVSQKRIVPFYKFNYSWVVRRIAVDYYLRVVVPLGFILLVIYFSVFLSPARFDSIMAIQVTALLSAIALYLALPKVESDQATLSDKIFIVTNAAVCLMIGLSILKDHRIVSLAPGLRRGVSFIQIVVFPLLAIGTISYLMAGPAVTDITLTDHVLQLWRRLTG